MPFLIGPLIGSYFRGLPKTIAYLKDHMGAVQMEFLNKVGINSRPNGFPLMFGETMFLFLIFQTGHASELLEKTDYERLG